MKNESEASHDEYLKLLPWYVNESLTDKERIRVMAHLSECSTCRVERDQLQLLQENIKRDDAEVTDYRFSFSKLMKRIDASEENKNSSEDLSGFQPSKRRGSDWRWPMFATAASLVFGVFLAANLGQSISNEPIAEETAEKEYRTLSQVVEQDGIPHRLGLSFDESLSPRDLSRVLSELQTKLIAGPDVNGVYTVEINVPIKLTDSDFVELVRSTEGVKNAVYAHASPTH